MTNTKIAIAKPFEGAPKINMAAVYGASPKKPLLLRIPVTGERPITYGVSNLPEGLEMKDGIITGQIAQEGNYTVMLTAENALGKAEKELTFEIRSCTYAPYGLYQLECLWAEHQSGEDAGYGKTNGGPGYYRVWIQLYQYRFRMAGTVRWEIQCRYAK